MLKNNFFGAYEKNILPKPIAAMLLIGLLFMPGEGAPVVVDKIAAVVNGEVITQSEVTRLAMPLYKKYKQEYTARKLNIKMREAEEEILQQLIEDKLILSEAKSQGIEVGDKEIDDKLKSIKDSFETEGQFRDALAGQNLMLSEVREGIKNDLLKSKLLRKEVGWKVVITPTKVRNYFDTHRDEFVQQEKAGVLNIVIKKNGNKTEEEAAFLIKKIMALLADGGDFRELAAEYSEGPNAKNGGDLGLVTKGQMMEEIDKVIFSLEAGEVSGIVESPIGYHIFKVTEKIPEKIIPFETAKSGIEDMIYKKEIDKNLKKWLKALRKNAYISVK